MKDNTRIDKLKVLAGVIKLAIEVWSGEHTLPDEECELPGKEDSESTITMMVEDDKEKWMDK